MRENDRRPARANLRLPWYLSASIRVAAMVGLLSALVVSKATAQPTTAKIVFPQENRRLGNRIASLDRQFPWVTPARVASLVGNLAASRNATLSVPFPSALTSVGSLFPWLADAELREDWTKLFEETLAYLEEATDDLVSTSDTVWPPGTTLVQARRLLVERLARMPSLYRNQLANRSELGARRLFEEGRDQRDLALLRRVIDEKPWTMAAVDAVEMLGDLALERGDFAESLSWWGRLAPASSLAGKVRVVALGPPGDATKAARDRLLAKRILALAFQGDLLEAQREWKTHEERLASSPGLLAGKKGPWATLLRDWLDPLFQEQVTNLDHDWPTFAGDATRGATRTYAPSPAWWQDGPAWRRRLPDRDRTRPTPFHVSKPMLHPIIVGDIVAVADDVGLVAFDRATGKELFQYPHARPAPREGTADERFLRFSVTAHEKTLWARVGRPGVGERIADDADRSRLVCIDAGDTPGKELWHVEAEGRSYFEGAPLVVNGRGHVVRTIVRGKRSTTLLECYDRLGQRRWSRELCESPEFEVGGDVRYRQHLLARAGDLLVYANHAGVVLAADLATGFPVWAFNYPTRNALQRFGQPSRQELCPPLVQEQRVFVAPMDSDSLYCLDAQTGRAEWILEGAEPTQLLGVSQGRIVFASVSGLGAADAETGVIAWRQPASGSLPSFGRGLVAGRWVFWPTSDAVLPYRVLATTTGEQQQLRTGLFGEPSYYEPTQLRGLLPGNMAIGRGCLAIAGLNELCVYFPPKLPPPLSTESPSKRGATLPPLHEARMHYESSRSLAWKGRWAEAAAALTNAWRTSRSRPGAEEVERLVVERGGRVIAQALLTRDDRTLQVFAKAGPSELRALAAAALAELHVKNVSPPPEGAQAWVLDDKGVPNRVWPSGSSTPPAKEPRRDGRFAQFVNMHTDGVRSVRLGPSDVRRWAPGPELPEGPFIGVEGDATPFVIRGESLAGEGIAAAIDVHTGKTVWRTKLAGSPFWAHIRGKHLYLASHLEMCKVDAATGAFCWRYPSVASIHQCITWQADAQKPFVENIWPGFGAWAMGRSEIFILDSHRRIFTINLESGDCTASFPDKPDLRWDRAVVDSLWEVDGAVFTQLPGGELRHLKIGVEYAWKFQAAPGGGPPVRFGKRWAIATVDGDVALLEPDGRSLASNLKPQSKLTLVGKPAKLLTNGDRLAILRERNSGVEIEVWVEGGEEPAWRIGPDRLPSRSAQAALTSAGLVVLGGAVVECRRLTDGGKIWSRTLKNPHLTEVVARGDVLFLHPADRPPNLPTPMLPTASAPLPWSWLFHPVFERSRGEFEVLVLEAATGEIVERVSAPSRSRYGRVIIRPDGVIVSTDLSSRSALTSVKR